MRLFSLLASLALLSFSGCTDDADIDGAVLTGKWELESATRNNMETALLDGLYYEFRENGILETNLMGNEAPGTYEYNDGQISTKDVTIDMEYTVKELNDSTLHLQSTYQGSQFSFQLRKVLVDDVLN